MTKLTYLSLGAGVQSTALLVMSARGLKGCPRADVAIFADTQREEPHTYETLDWCRQYAESHSIQFVVVTTGDLGEALLAPGPVNAYPTPPLFTRNPDGSFGFARRKCTREFKILPIEQYVRKLMGASKGERVKGEAIGLQGISTDEAHRMKPSQRPWLTIRYPLIEAGLSRSDCTRFMRECGYPEPQQSACDLCPYRSDPNWQRMKEDRPESFERACQMDESLRDLSHHGFDGEMYLHASRTPLREVDFVRWRDKAGQQLLAIDGFGNECEGMCGV